MRVTRLALSQFRNHPAVVINSNAPMLALIGDNGAGKTNILEAISLLAPGRGLRGSKLAEMAQSSGPGDFAIRAECMAQTAADGADLPAISLATGIAASAPNRRLLRINGAEQAASTLAEWLAVLWLTPAMDRIFADTASGRRRFLDRLTLALFPDHARHATRYDAAMRARTRLLTGDTPPDPQWLSALEAQMAEHGTAIMTARTQVMAALSRELETAPLDGFARPRLTIRDDEDAVSSTALAAQLLRNRPVDAAAGRATIGPHRQDLLVTHADHGQPAERCSTGEQKALLLSIILAHGDVVATRRGSRPVLLLDEIAAHLDPGRRGALFERLYAAGGQVWMTGTEAALFADLPSGALTCRVSPGAIDALLS